MKTFSAITSTLSEKELGDFVIEQYQLDKNFTCSLFRTGMNHTYLLTYQDTTYVLRVYCFNWRSKQEIMEELELLTLLQKNNLSISYPLPDKDNQVMQEIKAPEGVRYAVLFSFAKGEKIRFLKEDTCFAIGSLMSKIHNTTLNKSINRITYNQQTLTKLPYDRVKNYFSEELPEMKFISNFQKTFQDSEFKETPKGIVHLDIWYDNMAITEEKEITIFDFDFCGNGSLVLDVAYFCKQLFFIEADKAQYELKYRSFLEGYQKNRILSSEEIKLIPKAGAAIFIFYLGIQAQRFDWSNIFLTKNYLTMYIDRIQSWLKYHQNQ